jgi:putative membrane protein
VTTPATLHGNIGAPMSALSSTFAHLRRVAARDGALVRRHPKLLWAALGSVLVPAVYALIVLVSVWDPNARTSQLPVALVNEDAGVRYATHDVALGSEVVLTLLRQRSFGYVELNDADAARAAVRDGRYAFAVLLPPDFSRQAMLGTAAGAGRIILYVSEGNSYAAAGFAKRFAPELAHRVNETLNERRWALVFDTAAGSKRDLATLRAGVDRVQHAAELAASAARTARDGARVLDGGLAGARDASQRLQVATTALADGANQLGGGLRQLGGAVRQLDARAAPERDLLALRQGGRTLVQGQAELGSGLKQLQTGAAALHGGASTFRDEGAELPFVGDRIGEGAGKLLGGIEQLQRGLETAVAAQGRLGDGTQRYVEAVEQLSDGLLKQGAAVAQMAARLPEDARVDSFVGGAAQAAGGANALADGLRRLRDGSAQLNEGLGRLDEGAAQVASGFKVLVDALPEGPPSPEGTPAGLAHSVEPVLEVVATVRNDGAGFAPNFVPLALWIGAVVTGFLFHFRRLPADLADGPRLANLFGRLALPALLAAAQALLMLFMLVGLLRLRLPALLPLGATLLGASLVFLALIFALVHLFGDFGKAVALLLLIVQVSAAGAVLPIELSGPLYQAIHPWLPLTWVVKAFRASAFEAYDGAWLAPLALVLAGGVAALAAAAVFGRWKAVPPEAYGPALEVGD